MQAFRTPDTLVWKSEAALLPHLNIVSCWLTLEISHMMLFPLTFPILKNSPYKKPKVKDFFQTTKTDNSLGFQPTFGCLFLCQSMVATHYNTDSISNIFVIFPFNSLSTLNRNDDTYLLNQMDSSYSSVFPLCATQCCASVHQHLKLNVKKNKQTWGSVPGWCHNTSTGFHWPHLYIFSWRVKIQHVRADLQHHFSSPLFQEVYVHLNKTKQKSQYQNKQTKKQNLINILISSCGNPLPWEIQDIPLRINCQLISGMNVASLFSSCLEVNRLFISLYQKQQNIPGKKKRVKGKGAAESQATYSSSNTGFHGISLVLCGGWTALCSLMLPTLHLCGQLSFGLPLSASSSFLLSNKTGVTKMKKSFNKLVELCLHHSPLKLFYCHQRNLDEV